MKFLLVPDKFKGSASAEQIIVALSDGILSVYPQAEIKSVVASDGGDGFLRSIEAREKVQRIQVASVNAMGNSIESYYLLNKEKKTAYIELANCSGLALLQDQRLNILQTSTAGTGIQIKDAIACGAKKIYIGLGGSTTNDAGMGILQVLGYSFKDDHGNDLIPCSGNLKDIHEIQFPPQAMGVEFFAVNDVNNPLYGPTGAAYVYSPQKGASQEEVLFLDESLEHLANVTEKVLQKDYSQVPGSGAAGGTAFGLKAFLDAKFINGFDFLSAHAELDRIMRENKFDYLITGEGRLDQQSLQGKLIDGILHLARDHGVKTLVVCGICALTPNEIKTAGVIDVITIFRDDRSLGDSLMYAEAFVKEDVIHYLRNNALG